MSRLTNSLLDFEWRCESGAQSSGRMVILASRLKGTTLEQAFSHCFTIQRQHLYTAQSGLGN